MMMIPGNLAAYAAMAISCILGSTGVTIIFPSGPFITKSTPTSPVPMMMIMIIMIIMMLIITIIIIIMIIKKNK